MTTELIIVSGANGITISSTAEARKLRDSLLATAMTVAEVNSDDSSLRASEVLKEIKQLTRLIEASRTEVKAPLLEKGRQIDALAKDLTTALDQHAKRIADQIGFWTAEQQRKVKLAMEEAQREALRLVQIKHEEERKLREQEAAEQAELNRAANAARSEKKRAEYAAEAERQRVESEQAQKKRDEQMQQEIIRLRTEAQSVAGEKPQGIATRTTIKYEVTDIKALYAALPFAVTLTANNAALTAALKTLGKGESIPGVRHWVESTAIVR
jgi:hypothetical protein